MSELIEVVILKAAAMGAPASRLAAAEVLLLAWEDEQAASYDVRMSDAWEEADIGRR